MAYARWASRSPALWAREKRQYPDSFYSLTLLSVKYKYPSRKTGKKVGANSRVNLTDPAVAGRTQPILTA